MGNKEHKAVEEVETQKPKKNLEFELIFDRLASGRSALNENTFTLSSSGGTDFSLQEFKSWSETNCPRLLANLQRNVTSVLKIGHPQGSDGPLVESKLLTPFQIWFVQCCIPLKFTSVSAKSISESSISSATFTWSLLYSSLEHGLSPNRFETKVFNYRSPTILFINLTDGSSNVVGVDVEWRQGSQNFGGSDCFVYELLPNFRLSDSGSGLILFNTKLRTSTMGLVIGKAHQPPSLKINPDFSNISDIEVWGCGTADTAAAQMDQKNWQKKQAERHAKVPLPGKWDENPDKSLLEMAGVKVDHSER